MTIRVFVAIILSSLFCASVSCQRDLQQIPEVKVTKGRILTIDSIIPGIARISVYDSLLAGKNVGVVVNQSSITPEEHTVDFLINKGVKVIRIFAPEHGFRGTADAGAHIDNEMDAKTGLPIISLYGSNKKPTAASLKDLDVVIVDLQDVGTRFYTYISTMHYVMEACAEQNVEVIIMDRPNPNGFYVDGPIREEKYTSFVGMHPIPIVHGLTMAELALMIRGEGWLNDERDVNLHVVRCEGYNHKDTYELPVPPSPNLPNLRSILLYPSLCLFEGTNVSIGRGTNKQFQVVGHPGFPETSFSFTPLPGPGALYPKLDGSKCNGYDLSEIDLDSLRLRTAMNLDYLKEAVDYMGSDLFLESNFFEKLSGVEDFRNQLTSGVSIDSIRHSWQPDIERYLEKRKQYLLYPDF